VTRSIETRLKDIEARLLPGTFRPSYRIIANSAAECEALTTALIADGLASPSDRFIHRMMVSP
jgi:hypothetical protein